MYVFRLRTYSDLQAFLDEVSAIADKNSILEMYSMATDEPFSFLTVKLTAKNKNDIFMIRFDKKLKFNKKNITMIFFYLFIKILESEKAYL